MELYVCVCVCTADLHRVTDAGLKAFSAAVEASSSITTVTLDGGDACEYLLELLF